MMRIIRTLLATIIITITSAAVIGDDLPPWFVIQDAKLVKYSISGSTAEELRAEMNRKGPHGWHGYTEWFLSWNCRNITVTCTVTLPYWESGDSTPELQKKYRDYWNKLALHEQGHVDIVTGMVNKTRGLVRSMACSAANRSWAGTLQKINRESEAYDKKTEHGKTQGAAF